LNVLEILLVLAIALVVIGPERFPEVLRAAGKILRELRAASNELMRELTEAIEVEPPRDRPKPQEAPAEPGEPTPPANRQ
jgi:Tat protein translocase TatB subunit